MGPRNLLLAILLIAGVVAGVLLSMTAREEAAELRRATLLSAPNNLPEFALLDQHGDTIGADVFTGQWDLVFFGFTHCPDVCPLTLQTLRQATAKLRENGITPQPRIVLVSVDPERDTPAKLKSYVEYFGNGTLGITGELDELRKLTESLGIFFQKARTDGEDNYLVDHSAVVLVIDPSGRFRALFSAPHVVDDFVNDLPILMSAT